MTQPKRHHSVFGDYYTGTENLSLEERQALEVHNKEVQLEHSRPKGSGARDLVVSVIWFVAAGVSYFSGNLLFFSLGLLGGIFFLVKGLIRRYTKY